MFSKDGDKLKSFLGTQADLQGTLKIRGVLRLDGAASGRIEADQVILSETATMRGEILARRIIVSGYVEGILRATELLEITKKGRVEGDVFTNRLLIIEGGQFNGRIQMMPDKQNVLDFESRSQELSLKR